MKNFQITENFRGYVTKTDEGKLLPGTLIKGSQNVLINENERVATRGGYSLYGSRATGAAGSEGPNSPGTVVNDDSLW